MSERFILACFAWLLIAHIAAQLYVPYYNPVEKTHVYSWIWRPVKYPDPFMESLYRSAKESPTDPVVLKVIENSVMQDAYVSQKRAGRNGLLLSVLGVATYGIYSLCCMCLNSRQPPGQKY